MPYLWAQANKTHQEGVPMMRSMVVAFTGDTACKYIDQQYMLGDRILVSPVFSEDGRQKFYLPEGSWVHLLSKEKAEGGKWHEGTYDYFSLPLYVREGDPLLEVTEEL